MSTENKDGAIFTDKEYVEKKNEIIKEQMDLESQIKNTSRHRRDWIDDAERAFKFAANARHWFAVGTKEMKTNILVALGLNPVLDNKLLRLDLKKHFSLIKEGAVLLGYSKKAIEPNNRLVGQSIRLSKSVGVLG